MNFIVREIKNPITPIKPSPIAETFAIVVNSSLFGFFNRCQTRVHCETKDFNLVPYPIFSSSIIISRMMGLKTFLKFLTRSKPILRI